MVSDVFCGKVVDFVVFVRDVENRIFHVQFFQLALFGKGDVYGKFVIGLFEAGKKNQQADKQGGDGRQQKFGQADYPGMLGHFRLFAAGTEAVAAEIRIELAMVKQIRLLPRAGSRADE